MTYVHTHMNLSVCSSTLYNGHQMETAQDCVSDSWRNKMGYLDIRKLSLGNNQVPMHVKVPRAVKNYAKCNNPARARHHV